MSPIEAMRKTATAEVQLPPPVPAREPNPDDPDDVGEPGHPGGYFWRIRKVTTRAMLEVGAASLALIPPAPASEAEPPAKKKGRGKKIEQLDMVRAELERMQKAGRRTLDAMFEQQQSVIAAGVTHVSADGKVWEPCRIITGARPAELPPDTLHFEDLPIGTDMLLFTAIMGLTSEGGAVASRLASFRGEAGASPAA